MIEKLIAEEAIRHLVLKSRKYANISRYAFGSIALVELGASLRPKAYLSHWTAADIHGISTKPAATIYINKEQSPKPPPKGPLSQPAIDRAFANQKRRSQYVFQLDEQSFTLLNGKHTNDYGVETWQLGSRTIRATNIPRTLIDAAVRPGYFGGVMHVVDVFKAASGKIDVQDLAKALQHVGHKYPFHQALGYYLTIAGIPRPRLKPLSDIGIKHRFYLDYSMTNPHFDEDWQVYVPAELANATEPIHQNRR